MTRHSVSGTVSPDCTTLDTGEPAGTHDGQHYWTWVNGTSWYLWWSSGSETWFITTATLPGQIIGRDDPHWKKLTVGGGTAVGNYDPVKATGIANVAEYVPVAAVVTNILLGATPEACQILNSRIVRGPL